MDISTAYEEFALPVYKYVLRLCHDSMLAENVVADVFAKLIEQVSAGNGPRDNVRSYLYQMAYHLVVDSSRKDIRHEPIEAGYQISADDDFRPVEKYVENHLDRQAFLQKAYPLIQSELSPKQRRILFLCFTEGYSLEETAGAMGVTVGAVKIGRLRAIEKLRDKLDINVKKQWDHGGICAYMFCSKPKTHHSYCHQHRYTTSNQAKNKLRRQKSGWS